MPKHLAALALAGALYLCIAPAQATVMDNDGHYRPTIHAITHVHHRHVARRHHKRRRHIVHRRSYRHIIGGRPHGCPHAYCGCGLARYLGMRGAVWNLAWNWARLLPRTHAHAGAVAVRRHHVMLLLAHVGGGRWQVRNYNGWRHLSYIETRSVRGYVFVDPRRRVARR